MTVARGKGIPRSTQQTSVRLPLFFSLGFAGSVEASDETRCRAAISQLLQQEKAVPHRTLCAAVMITGSRDLVSAECCLALQIPVQILVPDELQPLVDTFGQEEQARYERVAQAAIGLEVVEGDGSALDRAYECGVALVQQSELVVLLRAALTDPVLDEMASFARATGRHIVQVHTGTGEVDRVEGRRTNARDGELEFLNHLPDSGVEAKDDSPRSVARAWQSKLSANAGKVAPKVRNLAAVPILCTAMAAVVSGAAPRMHTKLVWTGLGAFLGLAAALLPAMLRLDKQQALWVRLRTATEVTRSFRAVWDTPTRYDLVGPEILPELSGMVLSLNLLKASEAVRTVTDVSQFKQQYREERVLGQMHYFSGQALHAATRGRRYRMLSKLSIASAILISGAMFGGRLLLHWSEGAWVGLLTSALFQAATVAGALLIVHDCDRRERRYRELHESLRALDRELSAFRTWPLVNRAVNKIERTLLVELIEWRSLLQNRKMPRN